MVIEAKIAKDKQDAKDEEYDDKERERIVETNYKIAIKNHSWSNRVDMMLSSLDSCDFWLNKVACKTVINYYQFVSRPTIEAN